jgi:hypothetical protein
LALLKNSGGQDPSLPNKSRVGSQSLATSVFELFGNWRLLPVLAFLSSRRNGQHFSWKFMLYTQKAFLVK